MALDKAALKSTLETIFSEAASVPVHPYDDTDGDSFATLVCDAVDDYLADIETGGFQGPAANPSGATTNPAPKSEPSSPITADNFRAEFIARCKAHYDDHEAQNFSSCNAKFKSDLASFTTGKDSTGFEGAATTTAPGTLNLDDAFDLGIGGDNHSTVAGKFADLIHAETTGTTVVYAAYENPGGFAGAGGGGNLE